MYIEAYVHKYVYMCIYMDKFTTEEDKGGQFKKILILIMHISIRIINKLGIGKFKKREKRKKT